MSLVTLGGNRVHRARVSMPIRGVWFVEADVEATTLVDGEILELVAPGLKLKGTSYRSGFFAAHGGVRMVGGADGLSKALRANAYRRLQFHHCLEDLARETGETLSPTCDAAVMATFLERWTRPRGTGSEGLAALLELVPGTAWRTLDDGSIWVGSEPWPAFTGKFQVLEDDPAAGRLVLASEAAELRPGMLLDGRRVTRVEHAFEATSVRTEVEYTVDAERAGTTRLLDAFSTLVRRIMQGAKLHVRFLAAIVSQAADGTVAVKFDRGEVAGTDGIPIRLGLPGFKVKVPAGARAAVAFEEGDPTRPAVVGFDAGSSVTEVAFDGGTKGVARVDDSIDAGTLLVVISGTPPAVTAITHYAPGATLPAFAPPTFSIALTGKITSGNTKLRA